jgi:ribosome assembly protein 4
VRLWNPKTGLPLHPQPLRGHTKWINSLAWEPYHLQEPETPRLASASKDSTLRIWDAISGRCHLILSGHKDSITCVRWGGLPNSPKLYTSSLDRTIKIWNPSSGTLITTLNTHTHRVNQLALSTDFALRTAFHTHTGIIPPTASEKHAAALSRYLASATTNNVVSEHLVSASDDSTLFIWDPYNSKPLHRLHGHQKPINHVTFSPDGLLIASASFDNHVKLWDARTGQFLHTLRGHVGPVYQVCFSPDSRLLVSGSKDTTVKVWDVRTGKLVTDCPGHRDEVFAVDWGFDGNRVGSGGKDKQVKIWRN